MNRIALLSIESTTDISFTCKDVVKYKLAYGDYVLMFDTCFVDLE